MQRRVGDASKRQIDADQGRQVVEISLDLDLVEEFQKRWPDRWREQMERQLAAASELL